MKIHFPFGLRCKYSSFIFVYSPLIYFNIVRCKIFVKTDPNETYCCTKTYWKSYCDTTRIIFIYNRMIYSYLIAGGVYHFTSYENIYLKYPNFNFILIILFMLTSFLMTSNEQKNINTRLKS